MERGAAHTKPMEPPGHCVSRVGMFGCVDLRETSQPQLQRFCIVLGNKYVQSKLKKYVLPPTCSSDYTQCALMPGNEGKRLETKSSTSQGEAKLFVFITKTHRKETQNMRQPNASGENHIRAEDLPRVNVCFHPGALRSA